MAEAQPAPVLFSGLGSGLATPEVVRRPGLSPNWHLPSPTACQSHPLDYITSSASLDHPPLFD
ncbi:uncharacterized protein N7479_001733 [Penicillium vulpinum]|uniref:uncharacterized protein n=1 Tax=Penicillium vulpinum TaxID=29845 RepID=UPI00254953AB|nr:uncharacterized protein N7479_001733 [Penicillium vulpinum]KAJ5971815.1 hypothetical protein N7479_001733 [Penicillium vulpinum]